MKRGLQLMGVLLVLGSLVGSAHALDIRSHYSPLDRQRPRRPRTDYIVLHTTEGASRGALAKLRAAGEAHYLVDERGRVTRIIRHGRVATHSGLAMWDGHRDLDDRSIGIEVAGYHDRGLRPTQVQALAELLRQLQQMYRIPDERVLTHSMVAYGTPHRYHRYRHRGRKRCGMLFARPELRARLGLTSAPTHDPDVAAGRLRVADRILFAALFPEPAETRTARAKSTARRGKETVSARTPTRKSVARGGRSPGDGSEGGPSPRSGSEGGPSEPVRPDVVRVARSGRPARAWVGAQFGDERTIYLFPSGLVRTGAALRRDRDGQELLAALPRGTRVLLDKQYGGYVTGSRAPSAIAGSRWNDPATLYRLPGGDLVPGHRLEPSRIPRHTLVFPPA